MHHPKRAKVQRRRFCYVCAAPGKRLVTEEPPPPKPKPDRSAQILEWKRRNPERVKEHERKWRAKRRKS